MAESFQIVYRNHSGFTVQCGTTLLVFDYWRGENGELTRALTEEQLRRFEKIYIFISHEHPDHLDPLVFTWREIPGVSYIVSYDMPIGTRGKRMNPGDDLVLDEDTRVHAYDSTDLGVSFLVDFRGLRIFHAGDLNFWHWREESSIREIEEAEQDFHRAVEPIISHPVDLAFFPVDPRQGALYDAGANYFIMTVKPSILIPMHFWGRADLIQEFARRSRYADTEIIPLTRSGDRMDIAMQEDGSMTVTVTDAPRIPVMPQPEEPAEIDSVRLEGYEGGDPFADSDLPVSMGDNPPVQE